ncbi:glycine cleavage system aminomethyltransferase GcvT [Microvirga sp. SRT01]|uniref:aminomethyltransferase n=1 Tax=Sphingomonas longa TaxID=2778730 RepID=A0ABS2D6C0_9SPHN|nr:MULTISPECIES: glycine cleavage system aminomethyltransferase GcvT [Alphaproteobacteria]MBM6576093.1 glycine cleavage system aminomethyltransferase GcvT [Sphingomonas sp. BT552]MBR7709139.1 glycine cleavage system aminomethyltransferase GcvT [Microvirga sp. SRT01]
MSDLEIGEQIVAIEDAPEGEDVIQLLPLDAWHRARGGRMVPFAGYEMPVQYEGIMAEHLWTRQSAGLFDVSHMGQLVFTYGDDETGDTDAVAKALEAVLPGDVTGLKQGRMRYSLLLAEDGGILDDLMVTRRTVDGTDEVYMVVNGATKYDDIGYLLEVLPDDVTMNLQDEQALLAVQGPKAVDALARLVPGVEALVFMTAGAFDWNGTPLWISRSGYTGEDGFEISIPAEVAAAFADAICAEPEVKPIGLGARDSLRLEAGLPLYGHDLDPETTPVMADLGFALSKRRREAGDFAGAGRILAERENGPATKRVGLVVAGRQPVREGATVVDADGATIGRVTSGGFAPTLGAPIGMAFVPTALATPGTVLRLSQRGKFHEATVAAMPFVPHNYVRQSKTTGA